MADTDRRRKNYGWDVRSPADQRTSDMNRQLAVLMDIRDELQGIHTILRCRNVQAMALAAQRIDKRLAKKLPLK